MPQSANSTAKKWTDVPSRSTKPVRVKIVLRAVAAVDTAAAVAAVDIAAAVAVAAVAVVIAAAAAAVAATVTVIAAATDFSRETNSQKGAFRAPFLLLAACGNGLYLLNVSILRMGFSARVRTSSEMVISGERSRRQSRNFSSVFIFM